MGIAERRERERLELRKRILDAARELFVKRGYEAVTMREIARRIEYSPTALYGHFEDKETLVRELCRTDFSAFAQTFLVNVASTGDPTERLCHAGLVYLSFAEHYPEHYRLMFLTELPETPPSDAERRDPQQNAYVFLRALVEELVASNALRPELTDVDLVSQTIWAGVHGAAALELTIAKTADWLPVKPREQRFKAALEVVLRGLARDPEALVKRLEKALTGSSEARTNAGDALNEAKQKNTEPRAKTRPSHRLRNGNSRVRRT
jgi:AcrR family transcriptional regulator